MRSQPIAEEQCYREPRRYSRSDKRAGNVLGAVLGSVIGGEATKRDRRYRRHCETVYSGGYERQELVGYNVEYKYKGQRFETFMDYEPGCYIDVRLSAVPVRR